MPASWIDSVPAPALAADAVLVVHALIVAFVVLGQAAVLVGWVRSWEWVRNAWFRLAHLATIAIVVVQAWLGRLCPLTVWEQQLRRAAGQSVGAESLIERWVSALLFPDLPWWVFVVAYTAFGALVAWTWWRVPPRWGRGSWTKGRPLG